MQCGRIHARFTTRVLLRRRALEVTGEPRPTQSVVDLRQSSGLRAPQSADLAELRKIPELIGVAFSDTGEEAMIRPAVLAVAMCVVSSAQSMPYVPLQQPNNSVIPVRQGCGLGRQLVDGICVSNAKVRAAVRKCSARKMRMVNGRCEPRARPAAAPAAARPAAAPAVAPPTTQQPAAAPATPR